MKVIKQLSKIGYYLFCVCGMQLSALSDEVQRPDIEITSWNIRREGDEPTNPHGSWTHRMVRVLQALKEDRGKGRILCLQEVAPGQTEDLRRLLLQSEKDTMIGTSRGESWFGYGKDEANPIIIPEKANVSVLNCGTFHINTILPDWVPGANIVRAGLLPRICTWAHCKHVQTDKEFYLYNTHFDNNFEYARLINARAIRCHVDQRGDNKPVIIAGDFNQEFTGSLREVFHGFNNARDVALQKTGPWGTRTGWHDEKIKNIDHFLVSAGATVLYHTVVEEAKPYSSDHRRIHTGIVLPVDAKLPA